MRTWRNALLGAVAATGLAVSAPATQAANLADTLASDARFSRFVELVQGAGLTDTLKTASQITVFAPTDAAFTRVPDSMIRDIAPQAGSRQPNQDPQTLQALIRIHLLPSVYPPNSFIGQRATVTDEAGTRLVVDGTHSGQITVTTVPANVGGPNIAGATTAREAQVVGPVIAADNGLIYPIDNVLIQ